ncbi:MAG: hypothetical protein AVDCRST_MAG04-3315, partial [uncultured Acetobacteraceae bacterium]
GQDVPAGHGGVHLRDPHGPALARGAHGGLETGGQRPAPRLDRHPEARNQRLGHGGGAGRAGDVGAARRAALDQATARGLV